MTRALAALLTRAIDYAGMFPPAKLGLASAFDNYSRYREGPEDWIVGRFVIPTAQLSQLASQIDASGPRFEVPVAAIGRGGADRAAWEAGLAADAADLNTFCSIVGDRATIETYEIRLPNNLDAAGWIRDLHGFGDASVFVETRWDDGMMEALAAAAESDFVGVKARTGGDGPSAVPTATQLAGFIQGTVQLGLEFKLTAGLHHAFAHEDEDAGARQFGFVPIFVAAACAVVHDLSVRELVSILEIDGCEPFRFADSGISLHNWSVSTQELADTRDSIVSFGSCSVLEPLESLKSADLINR